MEQYRVNRVWVDDAHIWAETQNGWKANYPFSRWSRLANATPAQRKAFVLSRYGIHWPELDEDLCFEGLFADAGMYKPSNAEDTILLSSIIMRLNKRNETPHLAQGYDCAGAKI